MKISELITQLQQISAENGDLEVMFEEPNYDGVYCVDRANLHVAEEDEYPEDWLMPKGFRFALLRMGAA